MKIEMRKYCYQSVDVSMHMQMLFFLVFLISLSRNKLTDGAPGCSERGIQITSREGTITSPNYPNFYPPNVKCIWNITVPAGFIIRFTVNGLNVLNINSRNDVGLFAQDGPSLPQSPGMFILSYVLTPQTFYTSSGHLLLTFKSDRLQANGFQARFAAQKDDQRCPINTTNLVATNRTRSLPIPYFPATYPANLLCTWLITAPQHHVVVLYFRRFDMQISFGCKDDYFLVRDGPNSSSPLLVRLCGLNKFCPMSSSGRYMWIKFVSDEKWTSPGAHVTYTAVFKGLTKGNLGPVTVWKKTDTKITASNSIDPLKPVLSTCIWNLSVPNGRLISFSVFVATFFLPDSTCENVGYLDILDGPNMTSPRMARLCNGLLQTRPLHVTSSSRDVVVRFAPSLLGYLMEFQAMNFKELEADIDGCSSSIPINVTSDNGNITSPFHPQYYPNNQQCQWRITAPRNYHIRFRFQIYDLAQPDDYVEIRDGFNASAVLIGNFVSDPGIVKSWASTGRFLWVFFKSNQENVATGFVLSFKFVSSPLAPKNNTTLVVSKSLPKNQLQNNINTIIGAALGSCVLIVIASILFVLVRKKRKEVHARKQIVSYTAEPWEIRFDQVTLTSELGHGAFGKVWQGEIEAGLIQELKTRVTTEEVGTTGESIEPSKKVLHGKRFARHVKTEEKSVKHKEVGTTGESVETVTVAVKILHDNPNIDERNEFLREIELMKTVGFHRNIVSMVACCTLNEEQVFLVVEYAMHGDLLNHLRKKRAKSFYQNTTKEESTYESSEQLQKVENLVKDFLSFSWQIAQGMEYLASKGLVHRDLAARNILVAQDDLIKVADFGLSRHVTHEGDAYRANGSRKLPIKWMSPEAIYIQTFTTKSDVWSYGIVLWEIYTMGGSPYPTISNRQLVKELRNGYRMEKPNLCGDDMYKIMTDCWQENKDDRPSFTKIKQDIEELMTQDNPYLEIQGIDQANDCYLVPVLESDTSETEDSIEM